MHLGNRIAQIIPTLLLVSMLVIGLQQLMPGDAGTVLAGEERGDPHVLAQIRADLWLGVAAVRAGVFHLQASAR